MRITKIDAILSLSPGAEVVVRGEEVEWINPSTAPVTEEQIATELARLQADYEAKQYQRDRATEYPAIGDQLDALFHAGAFPAEMAAKIQAIKDKYPK
jgi:predicted S18 family serine protease